MNALRRPCAAVLFDRDGTLLVDRPPNDDASAVALMPYAAEAIALARQRNCRVGVVTNQSGIGEQTLSEAAFHDVNRALERRAGAVDGWFVCPHPAAAKCGCRKPAPGLVSQAIAAFGVEACDAVVIGDIGSDVEAARNAGALGILVPNAATRRSEILEAPLVANDVLEAVRLALTLLPALRRAVSA